MPNITPTNTPQRPAKRQKSQSTPETSENLSTLIRGNTPAAAGFSTPVTTPVNTQQATQLTSPPELEQQHKEYVTLEEVFPKAITLPDSLERPLNNLQQRNQNTSNRVLDKKTP